MDNLSPAQAQALWDAGGFIVIDGLPSGSEYGIDGVYNHVLAFSGTKFLPPGVHLITWSAPVTAPRDLGAGAASGPGLGSGSDSDSGSGPAAASSSANAGALPLRQGLLLHTPPRARILLRWNVKLETLLLDTKGGAALSDAHLKTLDAGLAAYPFRAMQGWQALVAAVMPDTLNRVLRGETRVDGMRRVVGEVDEVGAAGARKAPNNAGAGEGADVHARDAADAGEGQGVLAAREGVGAGADEVELGFTHFELRRSFPPGAVGGDVTRLSADKSWLLSDLIRRLDNDPSALLAELQLSFILLLHLSSFGAMQVYKRLLAAYARAASIHLLPTSSAPSAVPAPHLVPTSSAKTIRRMYVALLHTLAAQLAALPEGVFDAELPEMDVWYLGEMEAVRVNIRAGASEGEAGVWNGKALQEAEEAWEGVRTAARRFGWEVERLMSCDAGRGGVESEEEEEEGEYAPVVV